MLRIDMTLVHLLSLKHFFYAWMLHRSVVSSSPSKKHSSENGCKAEKRKNELLKINGFQFDFMEANKEMKGESRFLHSIINDVI